MRRDGRAALLVGVRGRRPGRHALAPHPAPVRRRIARCRGGEAIAVGRSRGIRWRRPRSRWRCSMPSCAPRASRSAERLGATREAVDCGVSVGILPTRSRSCSTPVDGYLDEGYQRIKLKIEPGWDSSRSRAVRERLGATSLLQVDANTAYSLADEHVAAPKALDEFDLLLDRAAAARRRPARSRRARPADRDADLPRRVDPVGANRQPTRSRSGACSIVNIKPGRVGGYLEAVRIHDVCQAARCRGVVRRHARDRPRPRRQRRPRRAARIHPAGRHLGSDRYFAPDITEPFVLEDGQLRVPKGPGLGVWPLADVLATTTRSVEMVRQEGSRST